MYDPDETSDRILGDLLLELYQMPRTVCSINSLLFKTFFSIYCIYIWILFSPDEGFRY